MVNHSHKLSIKIPRATTCDKAIKEIGLSTPNRQNSKEAIWMAQSQHHTSRTSLPHQSRAFCAAIIPTNRHKSTMQSSGRTRQDKETIHLGRRQNAYRW